MYTLLRQTIQPVHAGLQNNNCSLNIICLYKYVCMYVLNVYACLHVTSVISREYHLS